MIQRDKERLLRKWTYDGTVRDQALFDAFSEIPRENFISPKLHSHAYEDYPLQIGHGQTISQPTTIMYMLQYLNVKPGNSVIEIGAGCGYQAALLSKLVGNDGIVIGFEIIPELAELARINIARLGLHNITIVHGDGSSRRELEKICEFSNSKTSSKKQKIESDDFSDSGNIKIQKIRINRIIAACACPSIPEVWKLVLSRDGIILAPVGDRATQRLLRLQEKNGTWIKKEIGYFRFVLLKGDGGFK
jgi:protein-L-isoaspartate(D-aspartate) O-methyltransferase